MHRRRRTETKKLAEEARLREKRQRITDLKVKREEVNRLLGSLQTKDPDCLKTPELSIIDIKSSVRTLVDSLAQNGSFDRTDFELARLSLFADLVQDRIKELSPQPEG